MRRVLLLVCLVASLGVAKLALTGPAPKLADAPAGAFAAGRAMVDVSQIAREVHPVGSAANAEVRVYLMQRLMGIGLAPRFQASPQINLKTHLAVTVENIIAVLPGRDPSLPALAIMAHYDSTPHGPGAADDAGGAAAVLEIARALKAGPQPLRDVALVITDGEEAGLIGGKAFFAEEPLAKRLGFVINMEARGSKGRAMMFETGHRNGQTIGLFARAAPRPLSNSLMVMVYGKMPNGTDFTHAKIAGLQGLNFAYLGGAGDYHAPTDTPANVDRRSLQDIGDQALAAAQVAANGPLPEAATDLVYSDVFGLGVITYPPMVGWLILVVCLVLVGFGARRAGVKPGQVAVGAAGSLALLVASGAVLFLEGLGASALKLSAAGQGPMLERAGWVLAGLVLAHWAVFAARRTRSAAGLWAGGLVMALTVGVMVQAVAPAAAPVVVWPLACACLAAALTAMGTKPSWGVIVVAVLAIPGLAMITEISHLAFLSLLTPIAMAGWPWVAGWLLAPLMVKIER